MESTARLKKWGNSFGVVIPIDIIKNKNLNEGDEVVVSIHKKNDIKKMFGILRDKEMKFDSQKVKDETRKEWSKW